MPKKKSEAVEKPKPRRAKSTKPVGRPTKYSDDLGKRICLEVSITTKGLRGICAEHADFPTAETVRVWRITNDKFSAMYARAKLHQADNLAEDCLDIADNDSGDTRINEEGYETFNGEFAQRSRIRIDTRKWLASKLLPKQYGDKLLLEQKTEENDKLKAELMELRQKLDERNRKDF